MGDLSDNYGGGAAATFPVALYVLLISYFALLLIPYSDLLDVLSLMCMVKYASAIVMLISVIKLTRKLPNNLTIQKHYMLRKFSLLMRSNRVYLRGLILRDGTLRPSCGSLPWACTGLRKVLLEVRLLLTRIQRSGR